MCRQTTDVNTVVLEHYWSVSTSIQKETASLAEVSWGTGEVGLFRGRFVILHVFCLSKNPLHHIIDIPGNIAKEGAANRKWKPSHVAQLGIIHSALSHNKIVQVYKQTNKQNKTLQNKN